MKYTSFNILLLYVCYLVFGLNCSSERTTITRTTDADVSLLDQGDAALDTISTTDAGGMDVNSDATKGSDGSDASEVDDGIPRFHTFRIIEGQADRVYFDSSIGIATFSTTGFTISGKDISAVEIVANQKNGHYFTVSEPFTFWDNNTIRYNGEGDASVHSFLLHHIKNELPEPDALNNYYIANDGDDGNSGLTENQPFRTLNRALDEATAGTTIWVKAGLYRDGRHEFPMSGEVNSPIKIIGYKNSPGDIQTMYYDYDPTQLAPGLNADEMPHFDGENLDKAGLISVDKNYLIVRNLQFSRYAVGVAAIRGKGVLVDRTVVKDMYGDGAEEGAGIELGTTKNDGSPYEKSNYRITDTVAINGGIGNIFIVGSHSLVDGCKTYGDQAGGLYGPDYYISITGDNNIVLNSRAEKLDPSVNGSSHGIGAKGTEWNYGDWGVTTTYNLFENNYSMGSQECFYARNPKADYNVFRKNEAAGFGTGTSDGLGISNQTGRDTTPTIECICTI